MRGQSAEREASHLREIKVEYLVIGGYAVGTYGYIRATNDLDI
jgi:hypothetical protein